MTYVCVVCVCPAHICDMCVCVSCLHVCTALLLLYYCFTTALLVCVLQLHLYSRAEGERQECRPNGQVNTLKFVAPAYAKTFTAGDT